LPWAYKNSGGGTGSDRVTLFMWRGTQHALSASPLHDGAVIVRKAECNVMSCDYNGWNDAPEEEREWFDQHPEIWSGPLREADRRPLRVTARMIHRIRRWL